MAYMCNFNIACRCSVWYVLVYAIYTTHHLHCVGILTYTLSYIHPYTLSFIYTPYYVIYPMLYAVGGCGRGGALLAGGQDRYTYRFSRQHSAVRRGH